MTNDREFEDILPLPKGWVLFTDGERVFRGPTLRQPRDVRYPLDLVWSPWRSRKSMKNPVFQLGEWDARFFLRVFKPFSVVPDFGQGERK